VNPALAKASAGLQVAPTLQRRNSPLQSGAEQVRRLNALALHDARNGEFERHLERAELAPLTALGIEVFQLNVGKVCNQTCAHCHVDAGPEREESMSRETAELAMRVLAATDIPVVDITGGAPELNPHFEYLVRESRRLGRRVMHRCNLTVLVSKPFEHLAQFLADEQVEVICSLPHYRALSTDKQRGAGVFERSIEALRRLNAVGYGVEGRGLKLVVVTNPVGAFLPSSQASLVREWKRELLRQHGVTFDELYTITNMPISRFLEWLESSGNARDYLQLLVDSFNPGAARGVMCRTTLSVGWDGKLYDCDFNQMLELELGFGVPRHLREFDAALLARRRIVTGRHCFGCTAGAGSSCGGALEQPNGS
jgi:radical SAM/Cys-rich protein